ncbi:MAG TPA: integration host factor subunit alpha [Syntrophorhabdaceae bacterium]|nr:integration host factor subunit alpha [Syntrophorhabdaceae bacterium]HOL04519.1 integration host factor subunit alpha [Syntrophorhabdaceae bacterium]HON86296.1 integration host factor subunit alpha [Syntrophorhabdaceae bacterium]HOT42788.1 integration host factor subunit alpha [Syntrophorhabdaceae bacterium]HPC67585.1 integration host factor subunit alpha [Syntrophorhabdaceae bacterium]
MTKIEIVASLYEKLGFSKRECANIVDAFFQTIKETLAKEENVKLSGFGNFIVKTKRARRGRNPQTGEEIKIAERKVLNFRLSQVFKEEINSK